MHLFSEKRNPNISRLLLLEPNENFHQALRENAKKYGLIGRFDIIGGGLDDLERIGIHAGSIDTVTTVHVLCSVNQPHTLIKGIYRHLKPGGQWLIYEHVKVKRGNSFSAFWQGAYAFRHNSWDILLTVFLEQPLLTSSGRSFWTDAP